MRASLKICCGLVALLGPVRPVHSQVPVYPSYSASSIANAAANIAGFYAANIFISIYGQHLSSVTQAILASDIHYINLPGQLPGSGVRVLINHQPASIFYVSPTQVNVLIPITLTPGPVVVQVVDDGRAGPEVVIRLDEAAPALFAMEDGLAIATHLDGQLVTRESPAGRGEIVVLYAGGLGATSPTTVASQIPQVPARLVRSSSFQVLLNGVPVDSSKILYAGVAPFFAGLFQINLRLPDYAPNDPDIRIGFPGQLSPPGRLLPLR